MTTPCGKQLIKDKSAKTITVSKLTTVKIKEMQISTAKKQQESMENMEIKNMEF